ncbi:hypothetical protein [Streptomyces sp. NBC_01445]|uniref:hypothetical protein n=1 Tax=Streptomyces sp. NBC_01445 TaxID=2903869 RepID=UPI003FA3CE92
MTAVQADRTGLSAGRREAVDVCRRYLTGHLDQLRYDIALVDLHRRRTVPCGHLIGGLDITGARWGLHGAEAVLKLRTLIDNGDFDSYWRHHTAREHQRLYPASDQQGYALTV